MVCIAGKNNIAVETLKYVLTFLDRDEIIVCTNKGDIGQDTWQKSLLKKAQNEKLNIVVLDEIYSIENLVFISLEFDKLIRPKLFKSSRLYNVHFSLLPKYRGMYTSAWPILNGENQTGVTLHYIDDGIDTGNIIDQLSFKINREDTARELYFKYLKYGKMLIKENIKDLIFKESIDSYPQDKFEATYYSKGSINYNKLEICLKQTANNICNQIRAYSFEEYQFPVVLNKKIKKCQITESKSSKIAGNVVYECNEKIIVSSLDYDVIMFF